MSDSFYHSTLMPPQVNGSLCRELSDIGTAAALFQGGPVGYVTRIPDKDFIMGRVVVSDKGCWVWQRSCYASGYGEIRQGWSSEAAHRVAYRLWVGPIPPGLLVCHHCDNPPCCNPAHLFLGTAKDNNRDAAIKGRSSKPPLLCGENQHLSRLSVLDAAVIRNLVSEGFTDSEIAPHFDICNATVWWIRKGKTWKRPAGLLINKEKP